MQRKNKNSFIIIKYYVFLFLLVLAGRFKGGANIKNEIEKLIYKGLNLKRSLLRTRKLYLDFFNYFLEKGYYIYFATFTFNDEFLECFNRKAFSDYLRRNCCVDCLLSVDFGKLNGRRHYHGIVCLDYQLNCKNCDYFNKFGFTKFTRIDYMDIKKFTSYIVKYSTKFNYCSERVIKVCQTKI